MASPVAIKKKEAKKLTPVEYQLNPHIMALQCPSQGQASVAVSAACKKAPGKPRRCMANSYGGVLEFDILVLAVNENSLEPHNFF